MENGIDSILSAALEATSAEERDAVLDRACAGDDALRREAARLIQLHEQAGDFLEQPPQMLASLAMPGPGDALGSTIGCYRLLEQIGEGGMGLVYMAEQTRPIRRIVALKVIKPGMDSRQIIARFEAERQAVALMSHPYIAKVLDAGTTEGGYPYFAMELVRGLPITEFCDQHRLALRERLELFIKVCEAVQHAHHKGVIHRDLKPSNILVELDDVRAVPKVIDFGIAKAVHHPITERTLYTGLAQMIGTPMYMSPEQTQLNRLDVDTRSDVYSLGVILYELLTGCTPFDQEQLKSVSFEEMRRVICQREPKIPSHRVSTLAGDSLSTVTERRRIDPRKLSHVIRGELDWVVMKTLEKDRARRYESPIALAADLQRFLTGAAVEACPPTLHYRSKKFYENNKSWILGGAMILLALLVGTGVSVYQAVRAVQARHAVYDSYVNEHAARVAEEAARKDAEQSRNFAKAEATVAYRNQYTAEMQLGLVDVNAENTGRLFDMLVGHLPADQRLDRRGWEWFYLLSRCQDGRLFTEHRSTCTSVSWSPDNKRIATASNDADVVVWDAISGKRLKLFSFGSTLKKCVAWSPDGKRLAWGSSASESALRVWDSGTDRIRILRGHSSSVVSCQWSHDGTRLATSSFDGTVRIWDTTTWECLHVFSDHPGIYQSICWGDDDSSIVTCGGRELKVRNPATGQELLAASIQRHIETAAMRPSSANELVLGTWDGECVWVGQLEKESSELNQHVERAHDGSVLTVAFNSTGTLLASGGVDGKVVLWDAATRKPISVLHAPYGQVQALAWQPEGKQLAGGYSDGSVQLWDVPPPEQTFELEAIAEPVRDLEWKKHDETLVVLGKSGRSVWSRETNAIRDDNSTANLGYGTLSPDGRYQFIYDTNQPIALIQIKDAQSGKLITEWNCPWLPQGVGPLQAWSPDSQYLALSHDKVLEVWRPRDGQRLFARRLAKIAAIAWDHASNRFAVSGGGDLNENGYERYKGHVHIFDITNGERAHKLLLGSSRNTASAVAWRGDGKAVVAGNTVGEIGAWDLSSGAQLSFGQLHTGQVNALDWTPDGQRVASAGQDGMLKVLDPVSGDELLSPWRGPNALTAVRWTKDGTGLAIGDANGRVKFWDATRAYELQNARSQARSLAKLHSHRARQYLEINNFKAAQHELARCSELEPTNTEYRRRKATILATQGQMGPALAELSACIDLDANNATLRRFRMDINAELGRWSEAREDVTEIILARQDPFSIYQAAVIQMVTGDKEAYRESCRQLFDGPVEELAAWLDARILACCLIPQATDNYASLAQQAKSITDYVVANKIDIETHFSLGALLFRAGELAEAHVLLTEASRQWEEDSGSAPLPSSYYDALPAYTWYFLAMANHDLGRAADSRRWYERAESYTRTALAPNNNEAGLRANWLGNRAVNWHQRAVLEHLQTETRKKLSRVPAN